MTKPTSSASSASTRARRALCVGINDYPGTGSDLAGCVNDAKDWKLALEQRGFTVATLLDRQATASAIAKALTALVAAARSGDTLVFTFSGHGSWLPDTSGDEADRRDEMLCPYDVAKRKYLVDDDLALIFGRKARGVRLFFVSDSCHSGTVARFAATSDRQRPRYLPPETFLPSRLLSRALRAAALPRAARPKYPALLAAGCRDTEYSYDASFAGRPNGAFTYFALRALRPNPKTAKLWMDAIRASLPSSAHPQTPTLFGTTSQKNAAMF